MKLYKTILFPLIICALLSPVFAQEEKPAETKKEHIKKNLKETAGMAKKTAKNIKTIIKKDLKEVKGKVKEDLKEVKKETKQKAQEAKKDTKNIWHKIRDGAKDALHRTGNFFKKGWKSFRKAIGLD
ncbi:MAG: hypothetical protein HY806_07505 [Nitrospirae bacterium]|nr:hypothetical protein [Nitrospirota bacterium]MBI5196185.1 hypothetical protein [Nitrospirota bacterium]